MKLVIVEILVPDEQFPILEDTLKNNLFPDWAIWEYDHRAATYKEEAWYRKEYLDESDDHHE